MTPYSIIHMGETHNWARDLRFLLDVLDDVPDPIERLDLLNQLRVEMTDVLTSGYERACWDARFAQREEEALAFVSKAAFRDYSKRWNGRLKGSARVRWADPLGLHRRQEVRDLTKVAKGETPKAVRTGFRQA